MNDEINKILATEDTHQRFAAQNMPAPPLKTPEQFAGTVKSDLALWQNLARAVNLKLD
jgi:tripartite-type tricarboxylate transporter receptor subunit TctC